MDKTNRIKLPVGGVDLVAKLMHVTRRSVFLALSGERTSDLALRIRRCALNHGGVIVRTDIPRGQWLTEYNHVAGWMTCTFWNGFICRVSLRGEPMQVKSPNGKVEERQNPLIGELLGIFVEIAERAPEQQSA